ncbi:Gfo/Idh/MocA family oxidoreductase [bacterium]|nr:Gfo/Idh/MocA family oxidoreductase [bacterium]
MKKHSINRRTFLHSSLGAPLIVQAGVIGLSGRVSANDKIQVGCIGVGPRGTDGLRELLRNDNCTVTSLCDLKSNVLKEKIELVNQFYDNGECKPYHDFRELTARDDIDAVLVATCDHWHVLTSLAAVRSGKDVYMEKPMGLSLEQDQVMRAEVKRNKRIFQFGTQQRSAQEFRRACEIVQNGLIGELKTVRVWSPGSISGGSSIPAPVPEWLDYEFWLGPAPKVPYTEKRCSNELWWYISDYALGFIAGWGIHPIDIAYWGAKKHFDATWTIEGTGEFPTEGVCDTALHWDIDIQLGGKVTLEFKGPRIPSEWKERYGEDVGHGTAFEGSDGWVYVRRGHIACSKEISDSDIKNPLYMSSNHVGNFLDCVRSRKEAVSSIDDSVRSDTLCHVSDIAIRQKRRLVFDPKKEIFIHDEDANKHLKRPMREPWSLNA